jgi:LmbE family N-acetylglucosaminyl deacetylase
VQQKTILGVFAHPDDESMGPGGTLAKYAAAGHRVAFLTVTDGGAGRYYKDRPDDTTLLRATRREETRRAAEILGIELLGFLGWEDRGLTSRSILDLEKEIVRIIRKEKPDVVMTFHGSGISYHPDHRVISLALMGAFLGAGNGDWYQEEELREHAPHAPSRFYAYGVSRTALEHVGWPRTVYACPDEEITTRIDTTGFAEVRWRAIQAHETQQDGPPFRVLHEAGLFNQECFVRVFPSAETRLGDEDDLLGGL